MQDEKFPGNYTWRELSQNGFISSLNQKLPRANLLASNAHQLFMNWVLVSHPEYQAMRVPIQLASVFLMSPASISFIHAIMYGKRTQTSFLCNSLVYLNELQEAEPPSDKVREEVELGLADLTGAIHWGTYDPTGSDIAEGGHSGAVTIKHHEEPISFKGALPIKIDGFTSEILVSAPLIENLRTLLDIEAPTPVILNKIVRLQFSLAVMMAHEMCHAINNATHQKPEPFYKGQSMNELGWAWENEVFGGYVETCNGIQDGTAPLVVCKFPSECGIANPESGLYMRRHPKSSSTYYYVSMDYIVNVQSQRKWDRVESEGFENDKNLLRIPQQVGYRNYNQGTVDDKWNKFDSSEGENEADSDDRVLKL